MLMKLLIEGDDAVIVVWVCIFCGKGSTMYHKMMWAKRQLTHNTPSSAIIRIHLATPPPGSLHVNKIYRIRAIV